MCRKTIRWDSTSLSQRLVRWSAILVLCAMAGHWSCPQCHAQFGVQPRDFLAMYLFNGADEATFRRRLEQSTQVRIDRIADAVGLDVAQRAKLELANQGDLCRFYRDLEQLRQKVKGLDPQKNDDFQAAWAHIAPVQQRLSRGIIDENSLSERILKNLLDDEQQTLYEQFQRERQTARLHAIVRISIAELEQSVPLTEKQRGGLIKLLDEKILSDNRVVDQQVQVFYGYVLLGQLPDDQLTGLLDEQQKITLDKLIAAYKNFRLPP